MLATPELIKSCLAVSVGELSPCWLREVPLYQRAGELSPFGGGAISLAELRRLPLITKQDIRLDSPSSACRYGSRGAPRPGCGGVLSTLPAHRKSARRCCWDEGGGWSRRSGRCCVRYVVSAPGTESPERAPRDYQLPGLQRRHLLLRRAVARGPRGRQCAVRSVFTLSVPLEPSRAGAHGRGDGGMQPQFLDVDPVYGVVFALYPASGKAFACPRCVSSCAATSL